MMPLPEHKDDNEIIGDFLKALTIDPPPDLALEIDITSRTHPTIYLALDEGFSRLGAIAIRKNRGPRFFLNKV
jgi:hypothetical protein